MFVALSYLLPGRRAQASCGRRACKRLNPAIWRELALVQVWRDALNRCAPGSLDSRSPEPATCAPSAHRRNMLCASARTEARVALQATWQLVGATASLSRLAEITARFAHSTSAALMYNEQQSALSSTNVLVHTPTPKSFKPHARVPARSHTSLSAMKSRGKTWSTHLGSTRLVQTVKDCHAPVKATPGQALVPQASPVQASSSSKQYQDGPSNSVSGLSSPSSCQPAECSFGSSLAAGGARPSLPFILPPEISTSEHIRLSRCVLGN